jgi:hypothetical protein
VLAETVGGVAELRDEVERIAAIQAEVLKVVAASRLACCRRASGRSTQQPGRESSRQLTSQLVRGTPETPFVCVGTGLSLRPKTPPRNCRAVRWRFWRTSPVAASTTSVLPSV